MKKEYDFSKGRRGSVAPPSAGKTRITIRLDSEIIEWFKAQVEKAGGGNYQSLVNHALLEHISSKPENLEKALRKIVREELQAAR
jgi:uncharacterized protein (DUF4415 family)